MRSPLAFPFAAVLALALAAGSAGAGNGSVKDGFVVFKDMGSSAVTEVRDGKTGRVISSEIEAGAAESAEACSDSRHTFVGGRWKPFEPFVVNASSRPAGLGQGALIDDLKASAAAWQSPFVTDCTGVTWTSPFYARYAGTTTAGASLLALEFDGVNVVTFGSLAGTMCAGALACTIVNVEKGAITEADMVFELDLKTAGMGESWSTGDATSIGPSGTIAIIDVATHEFGHFAGLGHVNNSPALTMYPKIHDGMQTLGLGDMKGLAARYQ